MGSASTVLKSLIARDEFNAAGLFGLGAVVESLAVDGWTVHGVRLLELIGGRGLTLECSFIDPSDDGSLGTFPFWRIIRAIEGTTDVGSVVCGVHSMNADARLVHVYESRRA